MWRQSPRLDERNEGTLLTLTGVALEEKREAKPAEPAPVATAPEER